MKSIHALLALSALILVATPSFADPARARATTSSASTTTTQGYGYTFDDELLTADGMTSTDAMIRVRPNGFRSSLIRPRTSFVPQMLQSVENL